MQALLPESVNFYIFIIRDTKKQYSICLVTFSFLGKKKKMDIGDIAGLNQLLFAFKVFSTILRDGYV